jgi:hypothetical protein
LASRATSVEDLNASTISESAGVYVDIVAFILAQNGFPTGAKPLSKAEREAPLDFPAASSAKAAVPPAAKIVIGALKPHRPPPGFRGRRDRRPGPLHPSTRHIRGENGGTMLRQDHCRRRLVRSSCVLRSKAALVE